MSEQEQKGVISMSDLETCINTLRSELPPDEARNLPGDLGVLAECYGRAIFSNNTFNICPVLTDEAKAIIEKMMNNK